MYVITGVLKTILISVAKGADLSPIELCFGEIQRRAKEYYSNIKI